jgi:hypothetical protein
MKPLTVALSIAVISLPLCAAAPKEDSVLVRAAKASGGTTRKAVVVITNETLVTSGGYFTTTDVTTPIPKISGAGVVSEDAVRNTRAEAETAARRRVAAMQLQRLKNSPAEYFRDIAEPPGQKRVEPQLSTTQLSVVTTAQVPRANLAQPKQITTSQVNYTGTTQPDRMTAYQAEPGTTGRPPER